MLGELTDCTEPSLRVLMLSLGSVPNVCALPARPKPLSDSQQDIQLAKGLAARPLPDPTQHGVDLLLGGHDHLYFVSKGVAAWDGYVIGSESLGAEQDDGVYVIKSGSDFRDLSDMELVLEDTPEGSVRRRVIKEIKGERLPLTIRFLLYF